MGFHTERIIGPDDGDKDISLIDDIAPDDAVHDVRGYHVPFPREKEAGAGDVLSFGVYLLVGEEEGLQVERLECPVQGALTPGPDQDCGEGNRCQNNRPVTAMGDFVEAGREEDDICACYQ